MIGKRFSNQILINLLLLDLVISLHVDSLAKDFNCTECVNSYCSSRNTCACNFGYFKINETHCAEISCENCNNGYCEEADKCQCHKGFLKNNKTKCVECIPNVKGNCVNSHCSDDGICEWHRHYKKSISSECLPICSLNCVYGYCSAPEKCQCYEGFHLSSNWSICVRNSSRKRVLKTFMHFIIALGCTLKYLNEHWFQAEE